MRLWVAPVISVRCISRIRGRCWRRMRRVSLTLAPGKWWKRGGFMTVGVPRCTMAEVTNAGNCPRDTMVGTSTVIVGKTSGGQRLIFTVPVYNIAPAPGEPLALAFDALFFPVRIDASVLSDGEYNARVTVPHITGGAAFYISSTTIWGDPAEHQGPGPDAATKNLKGSTFLEPGTDLNHPQVTAGNPVSFPAENGSQIAVDSQENLYLSFSTLEVGKYSAGSSSVRSAASLVTRRVLRLILPPMTCLSTGTPSFRSSVRSGNRLKRRYMSPSPTVSATAPGSPSVP